MDLLADTHVHLYPCYDLDRAFSSCLERLSGAGRAAAFLAERTDCNFYDQLGNGDHALERFSLETSGNDQLELRRRNDDRRLLLVPGRQVISAERIEVLALGTTARFKDGEPAEGVIKAVHNAGGIPVLPWSPGKWLFKRGQVVDQLLHRFTGQDFLIGDVSLRPRGYPTPLLFRRAVKRGYRLIAGSDPLPFPGEERRLGMYASRLPMAKAESSARAALEDILQGRISPVSCGARSTPGEVLLRLYRNSRARKAGSVS